MHWFSRLLFFYQSSFLLGQSLPLLLVVSLHGFRSDYSKLYGPLTNFQRLEQRGVRAHSMIPTFNTASIPNHYTLITGLYEEVHGLVSDQVYDPRTDRVFQSASNATEDWWPFPAIWSINEKRRQGRSGVIGWPQQSISVSQYEPWRERSLTSIIDRMLNWFDDPQQPINFGAIYFDEPGRTGYQNGPFSAAMNKTIQACDRDLGYLLDAIDKNDRLKNNLHLIVTSDHGIEQVDATSSPMYLEDYVNISKLRAFGTKTVINIFVNSGRDIDALFRNLSRIPHANIYQRENIPDRYHYKAHPHIGDLIIALEPGYELHQRSSRDGKEETSYEAVHGNAGYDNLVDSMKTIFYASGRQLKKNFTLPSSISLYNVDLFPLMCSILHIDRCPASNGSFSTVQSFLVESFRSNNTSDREKNRSNDGLMGLVIYLLVLVSFVLILIMAVVWSGVAFRNSSAIILAAQTDPATVAEQNQYKFTQINDLKLNTAIGNDNL